MKCLIVKIMNVRQVAKTSTRFFLKDFCEICAILSGETVVPRTKWYSYKE